jgi:hypothetical protein
MTNRPRNIATKVESAVRDLALSMGIPAHRTALHGAEDQGDVHLWHGQVVVECKAGKAAESASWRLLAEWWAETELEASRVPQANMAVLVVKRKGCGKAGDWTAFVRVDELVAEVTGQDAAMPQVVAMPLGRLLTLLAHSQPLEGIASRAQVGS